MNWAIVILRLVEVATTYLLPRKEVMEEEEKEDK